MASGNRELTRRWGAWAGTRQDLQHVVEVMEKQYQPIADALLETELGPARKRVADLEAEIAEWEKRSVAARKAKRADTFENLLASDRSLLPVYVSMHTRAEADYTEATSAQIETVDRKGNRDRELGSSADITRRIDPKSTRSFAIRIPRSVLAASRIVLEDDHLGRLTLTVASDDKQWALATLHEVSAEIQKHALPWGWLRRMEIIIPASWLIATIAFAVALWGRDDAVTVLGAVNTCALIVTGLTWFLVRWLVPSTQVLRDGRKPRATAVVVVGASLAFQVALALVGLLTD